jgi:hypothetical protein
VRAAVASFTPEAQAWIEKESWSGDYVQLHRVIDIARRARPEATELEVSDLNQAREIEPSWEKPLYHDVLLSTLGGD